MAITVNSPKSTVSVRIQNLGDAQSDAQIQKTKQILISYAGSHDYQNGDISVSKDPATGDIMLSMQIAGTGNASSKTEMLSTLQKITTSHGFLGSNIAYNDGKTTTTHNFAGATPAPVVNNPTPTPPPVTAPAQAPSDDGGATAPPPQFQVVPKQKPPVTGGGNQSADLGKPMARMTFVMQGAEPKDIAEAEKKLRSFAAKNSYNFGAFSSSKLANGDTQISINMSAEGTKATPKAAFVAKVETFTKDHKFLESKMTYGYEKSKDPTAYSFAGAQRTEPPANGVGGTMADNNSALPGITPPTNKPSNNSSKLEPMPKKAPTPGGLTADQAKQTAKLTPSLEAGSYTVQKDDNLTRIAAAHGTTVSELVKLNGIKNPDLILTGQKLKLPTAGGSSSQTSGSSLASSKQEAFGYGGSLKGTDNGAGVNSVPPGPSYTDPS